jgi:hypothetical protein
LNALLAPAGDVDFAALAQPARAIAVHIATAMALAVLARALWFGERGGFILCLSIPGGVGGLRGAEPWISTLVFR